MYREHFKEIVKEVYFEFLTEITVLKYPEAKKVSVCFYVVVLDPRQVPRTDFVKIG